ncbi:MAG: hypothetical protein K0U98_25440 [Deltaproteobacteria bacterium]|nr:hypothetical protein [Deltaproteobacteria bacterium]
MRDLAKSLLRFSWALPLYGARSASRFLQSSTVGEPTTSQSLEAVNQVAARYLGEGMGALYKAGDRFQNNVEKLLWGSAGQSFSSGPAPSAHLSGSVSSASETSVSPVGQGSFEPPTDVAFGGLNYSTAEIDTVSPVKVRVRLPNTTQGPPWPPAAQVDRDGNFIAIGLILREVAPGKIAPVPGAALVSKDTVPPLDAQGKEDFTNLFGAPHQVIRDLDLRPGSPDLDLVLHTLSWGPQEGNWGGGGARMPRADGSRYNLNSFNQAGYVSRELFPASSQRLSYTRPSYPLHQVPIFGFQGDGRALDVDTAESYEPRLRNGQDCQPDGCLGESVLNFRRQEPITLGEWLKAEVWLEITLVNYKRGPGGAGGAYTAARFDLQGRNLLPNSIYVMSTVRSGFFHPNPIRRLPDTAVLPNVIVTDAAGTARQSRVIPNPFPDAATDEEGLRIIGVGIGFKSDCSVPGAYPTRFGPGVDIHAQVSSFADGTFDIAPFKTVAP